MHSEEMDSEYAPALEKAVEAKVKELEKEIEVKVRLSDEELALGKKLRSDYNDLQKDQLQDRIEFKSYVESNLNAFKRMQETTYKRVRSEIPKDMNKDQETLMLASANIYGEKIAQLEKLVASL